jgi:hypothetical protein
VSYAPIKLEEGIAAGLAQRIQMARDLGLQTKDNTMSTSQVEPEEKPRVMPPRLENIAFDGGNPRGGSQQEIEAAPGVLRRERLR